MNILVVDDSKAMRLIVRKALRQAGYGSYHVDEAANGKEALAAIRTGKPAVILSDWNMPEMNGFELLQTLTKEGIKVPFGFVTSETTPEMQQQATGAGALFLLAKPFTADAMLAALRNILPPG